MWNQSAITNAGKSLLLNWVMGSTLTITKATGGNGTSGNLAAMTALVNEKQTLNKLEPTLSSNANIIEIQINAPAAGYTLNQIGIFAKLTSATGVESDEILLAVFQNAVGIEIPSSASTPLFTYTFYGVLAIAGGGDLNIVVDTSTVVTLQRLTESLAQKQDKIVAEGVLYNDGENIRTATPDELYRSTRHYYGTCATAAATAKKVFAPAGEINIPGENVNNGDIFIVKFTGANTAQQPYLSVTYNTDQTLTGYIYSFDKQSLDTKDYWKANDIVTLLYVAGTGFILIDRTRRLVEQNDVGVANGIATLGADGKLLPSQSRGGFVISSTAPSDTTLLWIDLNGVTKYYYNGTWKTIVPTWG